MVWYLTCMELEYHYMVTVMTHSTIYICDSFETKLDKIINNKVHACVCEYITVISIIALQYCTVQ